MEEEKLPVIIIGNTDEDADWILSPEKRKEEIAIHDELERKYREGK